MIANKQTKRELFSVQQKPIIIVFGDFKYVVSPSPNPSSIYDYKDFLLSNGITTVVKLCREKLYELEDIKILDIPIDDGSVPNLQEIKEWINIIKKEKNKVNGIAVHCISGLGRAPLFVCIGLIKVEKMGAIDAISLVRSKIPYALNSKQLQFIFELEKTKKSCCIM
jgi:protein tyrosine phosphatase type 4A